MNRSNALARGLGRAWPRFSSGTTLLVLTVSLALPLAQLVAQRRTWAELPGLLKSSPDAIANSFVLAFLAASAALGAGLFLRRWSCGWWLWPTFFIPGILLGQVLTRA